MAFRLDKAQLKPAITTPDGRVRLDAYVTRTGVFSYTLPNGETRREYRPAREVFDDASLSTFAMVPVTNDHPPEMVNASNARKYTVGLTGEQARADGEFVRLPMTVFDGDTIKHMKAGKVQVSVGYDCDLELVPGMSPQGERFDAVQRNIRVNHVAIVDEGRAGANVRVRFDAAELVLEDDKLDAPPPQNLTETSVATETQTTPPIEAEKKDAPNMNELEQAKARIAELEAALKDAQDKLGSLQGERDSLQAQTDKADKERTDALTSIEPRVRARVKLEHQVAGLVEGDIEKMSDRALKVAAIKKLDSVDVPADAADSYVEGFFASAIQRADAARTTTTTIRTAAEIARNDAKSDGNESENAYKRMLERNKAQFKGKGN